MLFSTRGGLFVFGKNLDFNFITSDYEMFFKEYPESIIIDEAQESEHLFKNLRGIIDEKRKQKNRFILTGSSSPELLERASESLAGRIAIVEIGTLKMNETSSKPLPNFYKIFTSKITNDTTAFLKNLSKKSTSDPIWNFLKGGYPEPVLSKNENFYETWMENYFKTYINQDIAKLFPKLDSIKYRRFISMLSELSGTIINRAEVGRAINASEVTVRDYLDIADKTFIWRTIPSYKYSKSKSILKMPKGIFRDSGLNHYLMEINSREKLLRSSKVGNSFEAFVIEEIIKGITATKVSKWDYYYYRTKNGAEVDFILKGTFGVLPIEIKFGSSTTNKQIPSLIKFIRDNNCPLGLVINNSSEIKMLHEKVLQIPVDYI